MNPVFFSSSDLAGVFLEKMKQAGLAPTLIITMPDKPAGRGLELEEPEAKKWAEANNIPCMQPETLDEPFTDKLRSKNYNLFVIAIYGKILPKAILEIPEKGALNVHPSLLPRWRGADPIRAAILAGDEKTGVSIILIDEKADHGPVLAQEELKHSINNTQYSALKNELAELGGKMLIETIPKWLAGEITPKEQDHKLATYTKKITKEDGRINWNEPAEIIERKIRALNPWPGTYAFWDKKRIKILEGRELGNGVFKLPGEVFRDESGFAVACAKSAILVKKLQMESKKEQESGDFLNGHPDIVGAVLN